MSAEREPRADPRLLGQLRAALALLLALAVAGLGIAPAADADTVPAVQLAVVVPLVVPQGSGTLLTSEELAQYTSPLGVLSRQLDSIVDREVAIAIDPMIIASIRALGAAAPGTATAWLDRLALATNETFALAYNDADLTLATQAGAAAVPAPQSLDFALDPANFAPPSDSTAEPPTTADPTVPVLPALPTTHTLLDWPYTLPAIAWPRAGTVTDADLKPLIASGYRTTILSSANVARGGAAVSTVQVSGEKAIIADDAVSAALGTAARAISDDEWSAAMAVLLDAIAAAARVQPAGQATVLAAFDRDVPFTGGRLSQTLTALESSDGIRGIPLSGVVVAHADPATIVDLPQDGNRVSMVSRAFGAERSEQQFASVAKDALAITAPRRLELLGLLANQWQSNPEGWTAATEEFLAASTTITSSVEVVKSTGINLLADRATLPIVVANSLDQVATVYISVRPDTGLLAVESSRVKLVIEANSQGKGQIPVQAISNGTVGLTISLTSASGVPIGSSARASINVQAGWETPIVIIVAALVVVLFAFGIVRTIIRRRALRSTDD